MIRVLHCLGSLNRGGIQSFLMNIYQKIDRSKVQFDFLLVNSKDKGDYYDTVVSMGGRCFYVCPQNVNPFRNRSELNEFFETHSEYKILHYHMSSCSYMEPIRYAHKYNYKKIIMHAHSTKQTGKSYHLILHNLHKNKCIKYSTDYFACSDKAADWLFGNKADIACFIPNGIDTAEFLFNQTIREKIRTEFGINDDEILIGNIGRFVTPKNHIFLIDIFNHYHKLHNNSKLILVGDGDLLNVIKDKVSTLKLNDYVIFTGQRTDVKDILQGMDLLLMPSLFEGFPVTLLEAQAASLPCVISENVTKQAKILNELEYVSLDESIDCWCRAIDDNLIKSLRRDTREEIFDAGYDSSSVSKKLSDFYLL